MLATRGYAYVPEFSADATGVEVVATASQLGSLYLPNGLPNGCAFIETSPRRDADADAPFDRPEGIGWHSDFSTHVDRPQVSLAHLVRVDPGGHDRGAWRVAPVDGVLARLEHETHGTDVLSWLARTALPFAYTDDDDPRMFHVLERRASGAWGLRFYPRAIRSGCSRVYGHVPPEIEVAISTLVACADAVGEVLVPVAGSLLVVDNWRALHDRTAQTVESSLPLRRSLLSFVARLA